MPLKKIAETRLKITQAKAETLRLAQMPAPKDEAIAALESALDRIAAQGCTVLPLKSLTRPERAPSFTPRPPLFELFALVVALQKDQLLAMLTAQIEVFYTRTDALPRAERDAAAKRVAARLSQLEREEEASLREAEAAGLTVWRRGDADPAAVLARL